MAAAPGAALALRDTGKVAVAYFGDGTANHGYFFECLNFAKVMSGFPLSSSVKTTSTASTRRRTR